MRGSTSEEQVSLTLESCVLTQLLCVASLAQGIGLRCAVEPCPTQEHPAICISGVC